MPAPAAPRVLGLAGHAGVGKNAAADYLCSAYGYRQIALAGSLKASLLMLDPLVQIGTSQVAVRRLSKIVNAIGWDAAKRRYPEVRALLQRYGDAVRFLYPEIFVHYVNRVIAAAPNVRVVVTDVRFPNEATELDNGDALIVEIIRPAVGAVNAHPSEQPLPRRLVDDMIVNDGTLEDLHRAVDDLLARHGLGDQRNPERQRTDIPHTTPLEA